MNCPEADDSAETPPGVLLYRPMHASDRELPSRPAILIHAGAGPVGAELRDHRQEVESTLHRVLKTAAERLKGGQDAVAVAVEAVRAMEDFEHFNAGYGAALCSDGSVELSAALMRGEDRAAGAVAGVRTIRNPIGAASLVLESRQVLMIGQAADALAEAHGVERWPNHAFVTELQRARLQASSERRPDDRGTVGAVCLDSHGRLAAATSTGGMTGQPPGRVGDSPQFGAGTWADDQIAVSCTGEGEAFIRVGVARWMACLVKDGVSVEEAGRRALADVTELGGEGGLIVLGADGQAAMPFTSQAMPRGMWRDGQEPQVHVT